MPAIVLVQSHTETPITERTRCWDAFLDAYSAYLTEPGVARAAALHLAGVALEAQDPQFRLVDFEQRLGWNDALARPEL
jgi:hypothetical protein